MHDRRLIHAHIYSAVIHTHAHINTESFSYTHTHTLSHTKYTHTMSIAQICIPDIK